MSQGWDGRAPKGSERACACRTNKHRSEDDRQGVSAEEIAEAAVFWILGLLGKRFWGKYSHRDVASVLALAASRRTSTSRVCQEHELAPTEGVIRYRLRNLSMRPLLKRANRLLAEQATGLLPKRPLKIAVDYTLIPYHGKPKRKKDEVVRGKPKSGTTWFHAYATAYTILSGRRVTVALAFVKSSDGKLSVVKETIRLVEAQGIEFRCLYLDRAFFTADIIHHLQARNIQFLMPAIVRGTRSGTRALIKGRTGYTTLYTMRSSRTRIAVTFPVHVVVTYSKGRQGKNKAVTYLYASSSHHPPLSRMQEEYRLRFGIESSYRLLSSSRIRTSTKDPRLRILYVATSLLLVNAWVGKKWANLSTKRRGPGGRTVHEDLLPYPRFLAMLQYILERKYGFILAVEVPEKKLRAGSMGR
jgi:putative transposase